MTMPATRTALAAGGGLLAAAASVLCCAGPLVAVGLGLSGAGLAATFTPLRPLFVGVTVLALGSGFAMARREKRNVCKPDTPCASPAARRRMNLTLWIATIIAIPLLTLPWWSRFVLR